MNSRGARKIYSSVDQTKKVKTKKKKKVFSSKISTNSSYRLKILAFFHEFFSEDQKKNKKTKRSSSKNSYEIRCESAKITKIRAANTNLGVLGLDLHCNSPEPVYYFGAQSSLGGAQFSFGGAQFSFGGAQAVIWGGTVLKCPPVAPGLCPLDFEEKSVPFLVKTFFFGLYLNLGKKVFHFW